MKIQNSQSIQNIMKAYGKSTAKTEKAKSKKYEEDKIEISTQAKEIQLAMKAMKDVPEVRESKINEIRSQLKEGTYKPSSEDVAEKILERIQSNNA